MVEMAQKKKSQSLKILLLLPIGSKRRKRDLIVSTNMLLASFRDAKVIIHKLYAFVNCFFYYFPNCRYCL